MSVLFRASAILVTLITAGCASAPRFPIEGSRAALSDLAGEWVGTYTSPELGRQGTIRITMALGDRFAHGDIRMTPRETVHARSESDPRVARELKLVQHLTIRFASVSASNIFGELDRYWDPDAGCWAFTRFRGRLDNGRLSGTFTTRLASGSVVAGRWQAAREQSKHYR